MKTHLTELTADKSFAHLYKERILHRYFIDIFCIITFGNSDWKTIIFRRQNNQRYCVEMPSYIHTRGRLSCTCTCATIERLELGNSLCTQASCHWSRVRVAGTLTEIGYVLGRIWSCVSCRMMNAAVRFGGDEVSRKFLRMIRACPQKFMLAPFYFVCYRMHWFVSAFFTLSRV